MFILRFLQKYGDFIFQSLAILSLPAFYVIEYIAIKSPGYNSSLPGLPSLLFTLFIGGFFVIPFSYYNLISKIIKIKQSLYSIMCIVIASIFIFGSAFLEANHYRNIYLNIYDIVYVISGLVGGIGVFLIIPTFIQCTIRTSNIKNTSKTKAWKILLKLWVFLAIYFIEFTIIAGLIGFVRQRSNMNNSNIFPNTDQLSTFFGIEPYSAAYWSIDGWVYGSALPLFIMVLIELFYFLIHKKMIFRSYIDRFL
jgi:hypothetical protein